MPTKAAFLPSPGDPFVLQHCLYYFHRYWSDEVDKLYVHLNTPLEKSVVDKLIEKIKHKKIDITYIPHGVGHGRALIDMFNKSSERLVLFVEDDSIIFRSGWVSDMFSIMTPPEEFMVIGSPRMSCPPHVANKAREEFGLNYEGRGDRGPAFWPCFFFARRSTLKKTSMDWGATELGDTFVKASLELRRHTSSILEIPQYHCSNDDYYNKENGWGIFSGDCGYMHFGSLSSGIESMLFDSENRPLKDRHALSPQPPVKTQSIDASELMRRLFFWSRSVDMFGDGFGEFTDIYRQSVMDAANRYGLEWKDINMVGRMYMEVVGD